MPVCPHSLHFTCYWATKKNFFLIKFKLIYSLPAGGCMIGNKKKSIHILKSYFIQLVWWGEKKWTLEQETRWNSAKEVNIIIYVNDAQILLIQWKFIFIRRGWWCGWAAVVMERSNAKSHIQRKLRLLRLIDYLVLLARLNPGLWGHMHREEIRYSLYTDYTHICMPFVGLFFFFFFFLLY